MELFTLAFMRRAFLVAFLLSLATPLIGSVVVLRRMSAVGDALSHTSLAGVAIGLCLGFSPLLGAVVLTVLASLALDLFRRHFSQYAEVATAVVLSFGIGLAAVLSGFVPNAASFNAFLFGSIVTVSNEELLAVCVLCAVLILASVFFYRELFYISFDEMGARTAGIRTDAINLMFNALTAVVVSVAARTVGALIISSLLVLPVASAMVVSRSYRQNMFLSIGYAMLSMVGGLFLSYYADLKPGGAIVLLSIALLILTLLFNAVQKRFRRQKDLRQVLNS